MTATGGVLEAVAVELERARSTFPRFKSAHEAYAVLLEEVDELWEDVKAGRTAEARREAVQIAAMAVRFVVDLYREEP